MKNSFFIFVFLNLFLYLFIVLFHNIVPFSKFNYIYNAHHYLKDPRIDQRPFNFLIALGQYDAQWYLRNAQLGYPFAPQNTRQNDKHIMNGLSYAFDPFYPLMLRLINSIFSNIELTAFIFANILLGINFISLYYVVSRLYAPTIALKTSFLLFTFPFSIFYRSYFTEGLYLFLLIWFSYFLIKKNFIYSALNLGLMNITRGNGFLLNLYFLYLLWKVVKKKRHSFRKAVYSIPLITVPIVIWSLYNYIQTGDLFYFYSIERNWFQSDNILTPIAHNLLTILSFNALAFHMFHSSRVDVIMILASLFILLKSRNVLHPQLWLVSLLVWVLPLLVKDTISFSRFLIVLFPLFIYGAIVLNKTFYVITVGCFYAALLLVSLFFVNWYWIG